MSETAKRHERVSDLFLRAASLPRVERAAFLERECGGDGPLRREVEEMLALDAEEDSLVVAIEAAALAGAPLPESVGPYRIEGLIGRGGMGVVYRARQANPDRMVALKVIRPGLASAEVIRRFAREASALGRLSHPGIARIFEAGSATSDAGIEPYFAMEFIEGPTITEFANQQASTHKERLRLLAEVCDAIHHAHSAGIVHRDLKPANILVTHERQPKVLDFGIARAMRVSDQATTWKTEAGQIIGTVPYMSPEQIAGATELDQRADVYSLGVIGYELLANRLPLDVRELPLADAAELIREQDPASLRSVDSRFRGDVETLIGKALEKDPERRYPSAQAFRRDIERYLANEPIHARPPSVAYQVAKYARRNRALVAATLAVLLVSTVATVFSALAAKDARRAAHAAELEVQKAKAVNDFLVLMLDSADPFTESARGGPDVTVGQMLEMAATWVGSAFPGQPEVEIAARLTIANTFKGLSRYEDAEAQLKDALKLAEQDKGAPLEVLRVRRRLGVLSSLAGDNEAGTALLRRTLAELVDQVGPDDEEAILARANLAWSEARMGDHKAAERTGRETLSLCRRVLPPDHETRATATTNLAALLRSRESDDGWAESLELYQEALDIFNRIYPRDHPRVAVMINNIARVHLARGDDERAAAGFQEAADRLERSMRTPHPFVGTVLNNLGYTFHNLGQLEEADEALTAALEAYRLSLGEDDPETWSTLNTHAFVLFDLKAFEEAEESWLRYARLRAGRDGADHPRVLLAETYAAEAQAGLGHYEEATRRLLAIHSQILEVDGIDGDFSAAIRRAVVRVYEAWGKPEAAASFR